MLISYYSRANQDKFGSYLVSSPLLDFQSIKLRGSIGTRVRPQKLLQSPIHHTSRFDGFWTKAQQPLITRHKTCQDNSYVSRYNNILIISNPSYQVENTTWPEK